MFHENYDIASTRARVLEETTHPPDDHGGGGVGGAAFMCLLTGCQRTTTEKGHDSNLWKT